MTNYTKIYSLFQDKNIIPPLAEIILEYSHSAYLWFIKRKSKNYVPPSSSVLQEYLIDFANDGEWDTVFKMLSEDSDLHAKDLFNIALKQGNADSYHNLVVQRLRDDRSTDYDTIKYAVIGGNHDLIKIAMRQTKNHKNGKFAFSESLENKDPLVSKFILDNYIDTEKNIGDAFNETLNKNRLDVMEIMIHSPKTNLRSLKISLGPQTTVATLEHLFKLLPEDYDYSDVLWSAIIYNPELIHLLTKRKFIIGEKHLDGAAMKNDKEFFFKYFDQYQGTLDNFLPNAVAVFDGDWTIIDLILDKNNSKRVSTRGLKTAFNTAQDYNNEKLVKRLIEELKLR